MVPPEVPPAQRAALVVFLLPTSAVAVAAAAAAVAVAVAAAVVAASLVLLPAPQGPWLDLPPHVPERPVPGAVAGIHVVHQDDEEAQQVQRQDGRHVEDGRRARVAMNHLDGRGGGREEHYVLLLVRT